MSPTTPLDHQIVDQQARVARYKEGIPGDHPALVSEIEAYERDIALAQRQASALSDSDLTHAEVIRRAQDAERQAQRQRREIALQIRDLTSTRASLLALIDTTKAALIVSQKGVLKRTKAFDAAAARLQRLQDRSCRRLAEKLVREEHQERLRLAAEAEAKVANSAASELMKQVSG